MSGPKKGDVHACLSQALVISRRFGETTWKQALEHHGSECRSIQTDRSKAEELCRGADVPNDAKTAVERGKSLQTESETLRQEAEKVQKEAEAQLDNVAKRVKVIEDEIRTKTNHDYFYDEFQRAGVCKTDATKAEQLYNKARDILRQSAAKANEACTSYRQARVIVEQKQVAPRSPLKGVKSCKVNMYNAFR